MIYTIKQYSNKLHHCIDDKGNAFRISGFTEKAFKPNDKVEILNPLFWTDRVTMIIDSETKIAIL